MEQENIYSNIPEELATPPMNFGQEQDRSASIIRQLSPQEHLQEQVAWLRGEVWDKKTSSFRKVDGINPFMNEEGIEMFFQYATSILSPIVTFSNYQANKEVIHRIILSVTNNATVHFHLHWKDYGIRRKTQINVLKNKLLILGLSAFYKALGAGDRNAGTRNISENISTMMRNFGDDGRTVQNKKGFFSRMNPFSR